MCIFTQLVGQDLYYNKVMNCLWLALSLLSPTVTFESPESFYINEVTVEEYVIVLKNGRKLIGEIISKDNSSITFKRKGVTMTFKYSEIRSMKLRKRAKKPPKKEIEPKKEDDPKSEIPPEGGDKDPSKDPPPKNNNPKIKISEAEVLTLIEKAASGEKEDVSQLYLKLGDELLPQLKKHFKQKDEKTAQFVLNVLKYQAEKFKGSALIWNWFLSFANGTPLSQGLDLLAKREKPLSACRICLTSLVYENVKGAEAIRESISTAIKKVDEEKLDELKELVFSRTGVGPNKNRDFCLKLLDKFFELSAEDWEYFVTHKTPELRLQAMSLAIQKNLRTFDKGILEDLYMKAKTLSEKVMILKFMDRIPVFVNNPDKNYLYRVYQDAKKYAKGKGLEKSLGSSAYRRLKKDSEKKWKISSEEWKKFFDKS